MSSNLLIRFMLAACIQRSASFVPRIYHRSLQLRGARYALLKTLSVTSVSEAASRIKLLADEILKHDQLYYDECSPEISDERYDKLVREANQLEEEYPQFIVPHSRSRRVGYVNPLKVEASTQTFRHNKPMLSLDNAFSQDDIKAFEQRIRSSIPSNTPLANTEIDFNLEPKIDGLSLSLHYTKNTLVRAVTRGNGLMGEDVTFNAFRIQNLPLELNNTFSNDIDFGEIEIRGEVYITLSDYER